jgi:CRISPR/Cas system CSM-associated protein Csm3 (group 7 of RAMP superfamily)
MKKYLTRINITVLGPFLTSATSSETYGLDKSFHRNPTGQPVIPGSHVKGRLRMALEELTALPGSGFALDLDALFGQPSAESSFDPLPGLLCFSDFTTAAPKTTSQRTRTAINRQTMTAEENQLRNVENLFPSGSEADWQGVVIFYAASLDEAYKVNDLLCLALKWLPNLGAEKGVGSGRLARVCLTEPVEMPLKAPDLTLYASNQAIHLRIQPVERLMIGGIKIPRSNYVRSEQIIPGSAIKGALAAALNKAHGIPVASPLSIRSAAYMPGFELLAEHFDQIRVSHAFPAIANEARPVRVPISAIESRGTKYDRALAGDPGLLVHDIAPTYFIDWKESWDFFGAAEPKEAFVTRTAIDDVSRRPLEDQLFTYSYYLPVDSKNRPVEWVCNVYFSEIAEAKIQQQVRDQFVCAVAYYLDGLGKLNQAAKVHIRPGFAPTAEASRELIHANRMVVTLQTDAVMLDPLEVRRLPPEENLFTLYAAYWQALSQQEHGTSSLKLVDFFARQTFLGGYLYHRYLGAGERQQQPAGYYPYYLTGAGSVFVLEPIDVDAAQSCLKGWIQNGLPLPAWALDRYTQPGRSLWQNCPFVPQNGYGEIVVNLDWHWSHQAS